MLLKYILILCAAINISSGSAIAAGGEARDADPVPFLDRFRRDDGNIAAMVREYNDRLYSCTVLPRNFEEYIAHIPARGAGYSAQDLRIAYAFLQGGFPVRRETITRLLHLTDDRLPAYALDLWIQLHLAAETLRSPRYSDDGRLLTVGPGPDTPTLLDGVPYTGRVVGKPDALIVRDFKPHVLRYMIAKREQERSRHAAVVAKHLYETAGPGR